MKIDFFSFNTTDNFYPKPEVNLQQNGNFISIATPWGDRALAKKSMEFLQDHFLSSLDDKEVTSPFTFNSNLNLQENYLRIAIMLTNDKIFHEDNKNEFINGIELFTGYQSNSLFTWTTIGNPSVFLKNKKSLNILSIPCFFQTPSTESLTNSNENFNSNSGYLPKDLLGLHSHSQLKMDSIKVNEHTEITLLARQKIPHHLFNSEAGEMSLKELKENLIREDSTLPFWIARLSF